MGASTLRKRDDRTTAGDSVLDFRQGASSAVVDRGSAAHGTRALAIDPGLGVPAEGFTLDITPRGIALVARDARGLNWGAGLLGQILRQRGRELPLLRARDWPDFGARGYMLDVSRDRVPTMATLFELLDLLEELRLNELQLYTEHSFAYAAHERV